MLLRNPSVLWRELDGEAILLNPKEGCSYNLNNVGTLIWKMLDGEHTIEDLANAICELYDVENEQALQDVSYLLNELQENNLVSESIIPSRTSK
jgi:Coenzyme PQQ synthesis protein D (PqqD)